MLRAVLFGILAGVDNFEVSAAVGLSRVPRRRQWSIGAVFAFFEFTMPFVGLMVGNRLSGVLNPVANWLGPSFMLLLGLFIAIRAAKGINQVELLQQNRILFPLALLFSLDNLMAAVGFGAFGYPVLVTAAIMGICSSCMCFLGLFAGDLIGRLVPKRIEYVTACYLIGLAVYRLAFA
jgi:putative Mn2+ efflux pump MntP